MALTGLVFRRGVGKSGVFEHAAVRFKIGRSVPRAVYRSSRRKTTVSTSIAEGVADAIRVARIRSTDIFSRAAAGAGGAAGASGGAGGAAGVGQDINPVDNLRDGERKS